MLCNYQIMLILATDIEKSIHNGEANKYMRHE